MEAEAARSPVIIEADRTTYSAKDMPAANGGMTTDLLRQVPELEVDFNGNVKLRGNQGCRDLSERAARAHARRSADQFSAASAGEPGCQSGSDAEPQRGRFTFFGGGSISFSDNRSSTLDERQNLLANPVTILRQEGTTVSDGNFTGFDFSSEFKLNKRSTVWANAYRYCSDGSNDGSTLVGRFDASRSVLDEYSRVLSASSGYGYVDAGVGFKHSIVPQRHELTVDLRRGSNNGDNESNAERYSALTLTIPSRT